MNSRKTNNSYLEAKVTLRLNNLPDKKDITVLDAYCGTGRIWRNVKERSNKQIKILSIDKNPHKNVDIICDNLKVLSGIDLNGFDIVDLDAYGCPFAQMQLLFNHGYNGVVFITYIQSYYGNLPYGILKQAGFTKEMLAKAQTIFTKKPLDILDIYLHANNITKYSIKSLDRKHYLCFTVTNSKGDSNE